MKPKKKEADLERGMEQLWESLPGKADALKRHKNVLSSADNVVAVAAGFRFSGRPQTPHELPAAAGPCFVSIC